MPHQISVIEILALVSSFLFGLWVLFPLIALENILSVRGGLRRMLRRIPRNLFLAWSVFAFLRILLFVHPTPILMVFIHEPLGTYLFVAAGVTCVVLWWLVELGRPASMPARLVVRLAPAGSFDLPGSAVGTVPVCPKCNVRMVVRVAKQGPQQGQKFYVCLNSPSCRETQNL